MLSWKEQTAQHWFPYLLVSTKHLDPLNIIFDNFGI